MPGLLAIFDKQLPGLEQSSLRRSWQAFLWRLNRFSWEQFLSQESHPSLPPELGCAWPLASDMHGWPLVGLWLRSLSSCCAALQVSGCSSKLYRMQNKSPSEKCTKWGKFNCMAPKYQAAQMLWQSYLFFSFQYFLFNRRGSSFQQPHLSTKIYPLSCKACFSSKRLEELMLSRGCVNYTSNGLSTASADDLPIGLTGNNRQHHSWYTQVLFFSSAVCCSNLCKRWDSYGQSYQPSICQTNRRLRRYSHHLS